MPANFAASSGLRARRRAIAAGASYETFVCAPSAHISTFNPLG